MMRDFKGAARKAEPAEVDDIAIGLGLEPNVFRAVIAVEAAGSGFDAKGRPKALFERHHFFKHLASIPEARERAVAEGLAYPAWGTKPYPKGSDAVYGEIQRACAINEPAALSSTSWGLGQIMGSNYALAGCTTVEDLVIQAMESEVNQLRHMGNFIRSARLGGFLRQKDWAAFARGYNGPGYAKNKYDAKLAEAYARLSGQK